MQIETLGWVFDRVRCLIKLPPQKFDDLINEVKDIQRHKVIPFKRLEKILSRLRHAAIGLPVGKGLCAWFNRTVAVYHHMVTLTKLSLLGSAFAD